MVLCLGRDISHFKGGDQPTDHGILEAQGFGLQVKKTMVADKEVIVQWERTLEGYRPGLMSTPD